jgi:hypothetical protein
VNPISIEYRITPQERKEGQGVLVRPGAGKRKRQTWGALAGWVFFVLLAVLFFLMLRNRTAPVTAPRVEPPATTSPDDGRRQSLRTIAVSTCVGSAAVFVGVTWGAFFFARREQRKKDAGVGRYRVVYTFGEDGLTETAGVKSTHQYWAGFHSFAETERLLVIRERPEEGPVIPKRLFGSEAEVGQVRELLVRKLTPPPEAP